MVKAVRVLVVHTLPSSAEGLIAVMHSLLHVLHGGTGTTSLKNVLATIFVLRIHRCRLKLLPFLHQHHIFNCCINNFESLHDR